MVDIYSVFSISLCCALLISSRNLILSDKSSALFKQKNANRTEHILKTIFNQFGKKGIGKMLVTIPIAYKINNT